MITVLKLIIFLATLSTVYSLSCTEKWHCLGVTNNYNYVDCIQGTCRCLLSFEGNATIENPCACPSTSKHVYWDSVPYCVSLEECAENDQYLDRATKLEHVVNELYDTLIPPIPLQVLYGQYDISHIFSSNIKGRITPFTTFDSLNESLGYWYGTSTTPSITISHHLAKIAVDGKNGIVSYRMDVLYNDTTSPVLRLYNLTDIGVLTFDDNDTILSFDIIIPNFGKSSDPPIEQRNLLAQGFCGQQSQSCRNYFGTEGYYTDYNDCMNFINNVVEFGTFDRNGDTFMCRILFGIMAQYYPDIYCPETGKITTKCVDLDYNTWYTQVY